MRAVCWVPWILWSVDAYRKGKRGSWVGVPIFIALAFLGGTLQHCALVMLAIFAIWCEESIEIGFSKSKQSLLIGRHILWALLGSGMAAMMLFPCADAFFTSTKLGLHMGMHGRAAGMYPEGILQPLLNFAAFSGLHFF